MKKIYSLMLLCAAIVFATGCSKDDDSTPTTVSVSGVTLDKTTLSIEVGKTSTLTAIVAPENATDKSVTWSSDKTDIATVTDAGIVMAVKIGTATITATTIDGEKTATCQVTVTAKAITWATGNLVADGDHGAKNGTSTDSGLYFQFGSLIGWSTTDPLVVAISPVGYTGSNRWNKDWTGDTSTDDAVTGTGDPCRYYLKGTWRLPTKDEYVALFQDGGYPSGTWKWENASATNSTKNLTFPASGYRSHDDGGSLYDVGEYGYYWSASSLNISTGDGSGHCLLFCDFAMVSNYIHNGAGAMPVRCVQDPSN